MITVSTASFFGRMLWKLPIVRHSLQLGALLQKIDDRIPNEARLIFFAVSLYGLFITWGYLQEKITSTHYVTDDAEKVQWKYPLVLNLFVNICAAGTAYLVQTAFSADKPCYLPSNTDNPPRYPYPPQEELENNAKIAPFYVFCRPALSATFATSLSYFSLQYISYPLMILSKSCKHIPVMMVGVFLYRKRYHWTKYISVLLLCFGIGLFTMMKYTPSVMKDQVIEDPAQNEFLFSLSLCIGLGFVFIHLVLDGVTSNEQDRIFHNYSITSLQMMQNINLWQSFYLAGYLLIEYFLLATDNTQSQLYQAMKMLETTSGVFQDIVIFCLCACIGQIFIFALIRKFGSLVWITISVTRQLFTILLSVFLFNHPIADLQWLGIALVFVGMGVDIWMSYRNKSQSKHAELQNPPPSQPTIISLFANRVGKVKKI